MRKNFSTSRPQQKKNKLLAYGDMFCCADVLSSHDDLPIVEDLFLGFDKDFNLVIVCVHIDYEIPRYSCITYVYLDKEEAYRLSKRLGTPLRMLPYEISECMSDWREIEFPLPHHVRDCFSEMVDCLVDEGCRFRVCRA